MPIHNFDSDFSVKQNPIDLPLDLREMPGARQSSHVEGGRKTLEQGHQEYPGHVEEFVIPGFRSLDEAVKLYFSGIRIPTRDSYKLLRVKISGGEKATLIWADDLKEGRAKYPVAAISRSGHQFNWDKFSPPYGYFGKRFLNTTGDLVALSYRPVPFLVSYDLTVVTERKRDIEYILYQILTRFNPVAEFRMFDGKMAGCVILRYDGANDASDKETGFDQNQLIRYEFSFQAEAWLPLPEKILKTVLGRVSTFKESIDPNASLNYEGF